MDKDESNQTDSGTGGARKPKEDRKKLKRKWKEERLINQLEKDIKKKREEKINAELKRQEETKRKVIKPTVSIALPGSILDNAQSPELRTYLAGQIARAAVVFNIDEIVIFDEVGSESKTTAGAFDGVGKKGQCNIQLARVLQYLECPQYLRKSFFPMHKDLQYAGLLNPLDTPHHVKAEEISAYREGVICEKPCKNGQGSFVNVGFLKEAQIDKQLTPGLRVTVEMLDPLPGSKKIKGKVVPPSIPKLKGLYWGYNVRLASSIGKVLTESPYKGGYDCLIGTSELGNSVDEVQLETFTHCLVVFGGVKGLEASVEADEALKVNVPKSLFHYYLNTCPRQGSHTIRTEEAVLITLSALRPKIEKNALNQS